MDNLTDFGLGFFSPVFLNFKYSVNSELRPVIQIHWTPSQIQALICSPKLPTYLRPVGALAQQFKKATSVLYDAELFSEAASALQLS